MNIKKDEDVFEDDSGAFRAQPADMEMCLMELQIPQAAGSAGPSSNCKTWRSRAPRRPRPYIHTRDSAAVLP